MVKAFIFDCFGVLTKDSWKEFCAGLPNRDMVRKVSDFNRAYDAGHISRELFLSGVQEITGKRPQEVEKLAHHEIYKNEALLEYIARLKRDYKIGLLSNIGTNWIRDYFLTEAEQQLFDTMVFSYETGLAKPDPDIFRVAAERLDEDPAACVVVDDSEGHLVGARTASMQTIRYESLEQLKTDVAKLLATQSE